MDIQAQIELIADDIADERCILLVGPQLCQQEGGKIHTDCFKSQIQENGLAFSYDQDHFLRFKDSQSKRLYIRKFKNYFMDEALAVPEHYKALAQMPFPLIFYASPDLLLRRAFTEQGITHRFAFYDKGTAPSDVDKPQANQPLIYNLFGNIEEDDSLLITQQDLFDFLFAILDDKKLPREIKNAVRRAKTFVFLGFDLERWYMRLILRLFELHQPDILTYVDRVKSETQTFYIDNFDARFIDLDSLELITQLYEIFKAKQKLREVKEQTENPFIAKLNELVEQNQLADCLQKIKSFLKAQIDEEAEELYSKVLLQIARLSDLEERKDEGEITKEEYKVELAKIRKAIIRLIRSIKDYLDGQPE